MDVIMENAIPIAVVFTIVFGLYIAEFFIRRAEKKRGGDVSPLSKILMTVFSVTAIVLNIGLCAFLLIKGADIADVLPILLLSLLETVL